MKRIGRSEDLLYFKFFVYLMGIALVLGCVFLSYMVYQRHLMDFPPQQDNKTGESCAGGAMQLHVEGEVELSIQDGNRVFLLSKTSNTTQELIILDYCDNKVISRVSFSNSEANQNTNDEVNETIEDDNISAVTIDSDNLSKAG